MLLIGALTLTGCSSAGFADSAVPDTTRRSTTLPRPEVPAGPSAQVLREQRVFRDPAPVPRLQQEHGIAPVILDPGTYTLDTLGRSVTLRLEDHWRLESEHPARVALTRPDAELEALLPAVSFLRPIGFAQPARIGTESLWSGTSGWEPSELAVWIESVPQVVVLDQGTLTVDGETVTWWDIDVDPERGPTSAFCQPGRCVELLWSGHGSFSVARDLERIRWYEIPDLDGSIVVFVAGRDHEFDDLVADVHEMISSARLGTPSPHPIPGDHDIATIRSLAANETWSFAGVPGIEFRSETWVEAGQAPGAIAFGTPTTRTGLVLPALGPELEPIATAQDIVDLLLDSGAATVTEPAADLGGYPATRIDIDLSDDETSPRRLLLMSEPHGDFDLSLAAWPELSFATVWVFDSPAGPAMYTASGASPEERDRALEKIPWLVESVRFCATESCGTER